MTTIPKADNCLLMLLRSRLTMFFERDMFTDVTLVTNTNEIRAHSIILASASLFFESHLSYNSFPCDDDGPRRFPVPFDGKPVAKLVRYIYTGIIQFGDDVFDMMALQDYLQVGSLRNLISDYLANKLRNDNVGRVVLEADKYRYADLATKARRFFASNFKTIVTDEIFMHVQFDLIRESLESDYLVTCSSNELIYNLCRWVAFDEPERGSVLKELLDKIDPIEIDEWVRTKERCSRLFPGISFSAGILSEWFDENSPPGRLSIRGTGLPRFKTTLEDVILFIGGTEKNKFVPTVEATRKLPARSRRSLPLYAGVDYPIYEPPTLIFASMRQQHCLPFTAASNGHKVFVTSPLRNVECYDALNNEWYGLPKFPESMQLGRTTTLNESFFICGPSVKHPGHELWVLPENASKWKKLAQPCPSTSELLQLVSVSLGSALVGLFASDSHLGVTIQHYDVTLDAWTTTLRLPRSWTLMTATPVDRLKIFVVVNAASWYSYDSVSCSLSEPIRALTSDETESRSNLKCHCRGPNVNESVLLFEKIVVQKTCCEISTYSVHHQFTGQNIEFRYGAITNKTNFALATVKIASYAWPAL